MFDDLFLLAALSPTVMEKRLLLLSVREKKEFSLYKQLGWQAFIETNIMVAEPISSDELHAEVIVTGIEHQKITLMLGDLAAFGETRLELVATMLPEVVKINFVTSPIDGQAFLPSENSDKMAESASNIITRFQQLGYTCWVSTWYRNDVPIHIWQLEGQPDMELFPFNIVATRNPAVGTSFQHMAEIFKIQDQMISVEHKALVERLNLQVSQRGNDDDYGIEMRDKYIRMLEDAMITLQPSKTIKLGGS